MGVSSQVSVLNKCLVFGCARCPGKSEPNNLIQWQCSHPCHAGGDQEEVSAYNNRLRREFLGTQTPHEEQV